MMFCWGAKTTYSCLIPVDIFNCLCLDMADTYACVPTRMKFRNAFIEIQLIVEHLTRTVETKCHICFPTPGSYTSESGHIQAGLSMIWNCGSCYLIKATLHFYSVSLQKHEGNLTNFGILSCKAVCCTVHVRSEWKGFRGHINMQLGMSSELLQASGKTFKQHTVTFEACSISIQRGRVCPSYKCHCMS